MPGNNIQSKTFEFSRRALRAARGLGQDRIGSILPSQFVRSATSVGANVEEAQGGQSRADFIAKMSIARKEARETLYWLRLFKAEEILSPQLATELINEADQILAILTAIIKTSQGVK